VLLANRLPLETAAERGAEYPSGRHHLPAELLEAPIKLYVPQPGQFIDQHHSSVFSGIDSRCCVNTDGGDSMWWFFQGCCVRDPALPQDALCVFTDARGNHLFAVYVQNTFTAPAEWYNVVIEVICNFTLSLCYF